MALGFGPEGQLGVYAAAPGLGDRFPEHPADLGLVGVTVGVVGAGVCRTLDRVELPLDLGWRR